MTLRFFFGGFIVLYGSFFVLAVRKAARSPYHWGPRWLAKAASSVLYIFGRWYLDFSINTEEALKAGKFDTSKQYLLVWHPHGAFAIAALYFFGHFAAASTIFPKMYCAVADILLGIPGLAEYILLCNARSINSKTVSSILERGHTLALQPGGIYEQVRTDQHKEIIYMPGRLGFVRLAIKHGVPLLPVYAFGENQLFNTSSWMRGINMWLYRKFKVGSLLVHSRFFDIPVSPVLPNPGLLPVPGRGLHIRWGKAIEVGPPDADPTDEKVFEVYQKYIDSLTELFNAHKDSCLPKDAAENGLEVVLRSNDKKRK